MKVDIGAGAHLCPFGGMVAQPYLARTRRIRARSCCQHLAKWVRQRKLDAFGAAETRKLTHSRRISGRIRTGEVPR